MMFGTRETAERWAREQLTDPFAHLSTETVQIIEREPDEHDHADEVIVVEGAETGLRLAPPDQPELESEEAGRRDEPDLRAVRRRARRLSAKDDLSAADARSHPLHEIVLPLGALAGDQT